MIRTASIGLTGLVLATCLGLSSPLPAFAQAQLAPGQEQEVPLRSDLRKGHPW